MSRNSLFILTAIFVVFFVSLFIVLRGKTAPVPSPTITPLAQQKKSGGEVDVTITPEVLIVGQPPRFKLEFNTHSVELDFDVVKTAELSDGSEKIYKEATWEGSPSGGHHRSGTLTFSAPLSQTKSVTLVLRDIAGIPKREFIWQL